MKLLNITFALVGLIATALASAVPRAALPRCTESNNETTTCGSRYSYGNDVFRCADLRWEWVERCSDPDFPCDNGACVAKQPECVEGEKECLTVLNHGHDGINICKNGEWATLDKCHCTDFPSPYCTSVIPGDQSAIASSLEPCNDEGEKRCITASGHEGDQIVICKSNFWTVESYCGGWLCLVDEGGPYCHRHVSGLAVRRD